MNSPLTVTPEEAAEIADETANLLADVEMFMPPAPRFIHPDWTVTDRMENCLIRYQHALGVQSVILSGGRHQDGRRYTHFSLARTDRVPTWDELVQAKELFLGSDSYAIAVIPPRSRYVNIHRYCLHLWVCLDDYPLPDFTFGGRSL